MEQFITVSELAAHCGVDQRTVRRWVTSGRLAAFRFGPRTLRIRKADADAFLATADGRPDEMITTGAAGALLGWGAKSVRRLCESGRFITAIRLSRAGTWKVSRSEVLRYRESSKPSKRSKRAA